MSGNRIQAGLDRTPLPWRDARGELAAQYGVQSCAWTGRPVVLLDTTPPVLPHLLRPFSFEQDQAHSPDMPPAYLSGYVWASDDAEANLAIARAALEPLLGKPDRKSSSNALGWDWIDLPAGVGLWCWPRRLNKDFGRNGIHDAEPRTKSACHIEIRSGFRPPLSAAERDWLDRMDVLATIREPFRPYVPAPLEDGLFAWVLNVIFGKPKPWPGTGFPQTLTEAMNRQGVGDRFVEYLRDPPEDTARYYGKLGCSPGGEALISCTEKLLIVPVAHIEAIEIETMTPGRSYPSGGMTISAKCRLPFAPELVHGLDLGFWDETVAVALAARVGVPVERSETWGD